MKGPTPRPAALKLLNGRHAGVDSGGRVVPPPPPFARVAPGKPTDMTPVASAHWDEVVPELVRLELLTVSHVGGLVALCEAWSRYIAAQDIIKEDGVLWMDERGKVSRHPAVTVAAEASREYRSWCAEFGLTPSSEGRLVKQTKDVHDDANPFAPRPASVG